MLYKYLCKYEDESGAIELINFKECKKTYVYTYKSRPNNYWAEEIIESRLKKVKLESLGFFIEAENIADAQIKRREFIIRKLKEDIKRFKEKITTNLNFYEKKSILAVNIPSSEVQTNLIVFLNNFSRMDFYFNTPVKIPEKLYSNSSTEEKEIFNLIKEEFFVLRNYIATEYDLSFRLNTERKYFGICMINLKHPDIKLSLRDPETLIIEGLNVEPYRDKKMDINITSVRNVYLSNFISYQSISPLYEELLNKWRDNEIGKELDFFYLINGYLSVHYKNLNNQIISRRIQYINPIEYAFIYSEAKKLDVKIEFPDSLFISSKEFILSHFRLKDNDTIITLKENLNSDCGFNKDNAMSIFVKEIKKQLGREDFNALKLISEVSDE